MTPEQIEKMLTEMEVPFRYHHFTQKEMEDIPLPIMVWIVPGTDNFFCGRPDLSQDQETGY